MAIEPLDPHKLYRRCDTEALGFDTTAEVEELDAFIGQDRAARAVQFAIRMRPKGYNLFVLGPAGTGKQSMVRRYVEEQAAGAPVPADWCYVQSFKEQHRPNALRLPPGRGTALVRDMEELVEDLYAAISGAFESEEYRTRIQAVHKELERHQEAMISEVRAKAERKHIAVIGTPGGFTLAPLRDGNPLTPEEFQKLPEDERERIQRDIEEIQDEMASQLHKLPKWQKRSKEKVEEVNREIVGAAIEHLLDDLDEKYADLPPVKDYLAQVRDDVIDHYKRFMPEERRKAEQLPAIIAHEEAGESWSNRYRVNLLVAHDHDGGAPVVYEDQPAYNNLVGRIEHRAHMGALETDFTMIRAGALHRANGGYLILDALKVLMHPFAWETLKRVLSSGEIRMESLAQVASLISTVSLEPEPIPLDAKVVLIGGRPVYYLLCTLDPEFPELFKVAADFEDRVERGPETDRLYARLVGSLARREGLRQFDREAVGRLIEQAARIAGDAERLTSHMRSVADLIRESDHWAAEGGAEIVSRGHVQAAIDAQVHRADRVRSRLQEEVTRGNLLIDTAGERVGQVNGLTVLQLGGFRFGHPSRITARTRLGKGGVVDIEREAKLGGPIHSKGVLILSGFLAGRYALDYPLSLAASLVFEQSYGGIEGDSASSAELYALLSSLAEAPVRQSLAVTGSVNQHGEVQAIGGVNEKIEGFFDLCNARGLSGDQGVLIPAANVKHLMLRRDVVEACEQGRFAVYPVSNVDDGVSLLTGLAAGGRHADGHFPADSLNGRIEARLVEYAERIRRLQGDGARGHPKE
jgi:lon-related putative ATP-dependent protease